MVFKKPKKQVSESEDDTLKKRCPSGGASLETGFLNDKAMGLMLMIVSLAMAAIHFIYAQYIFMSVEAYRTMHLCFAMAIAILVIMKNTSRRGERILHLIFFLACCCACIGTLVTTFNTSGLSVKLASSIETLSNGNLLIVLLIIYFISIIAGMCGVAAAGYFTIAAFSVSVLTHMGVSYNVAHFFSAYPAFFATLTPPVALVSLLASKMADTKYGSTALEACKVSITGFILPFLFCYTPAICLAADMSNIWAWVDIGAVVLGSVALQAFWCRYIFTNMKSFETIITGVSAVMLFLFCGQKHWFLLFGGVVGCAVVLAWQLIKLKKEKTTPQMPGVTVA
jgi:hypothetical protein